MCMHGKTGEIPVPALPEFEDFDLGLSNPTQFEAFRIYVPWMAFDQRSSGLPADFQVNGPAPVDGSEFQALDFSQLLAGEAQTQRLASISGPQTFDTEGWLPVGQSLPYSISFKNPETASSHVHQIQIASPIDLNLDGRSFALGDMKIGKITIHMPAWTVDVPGRHRHEQFSRVYPAGEPRGLICIRARQRG